MCNLYVMYYTANGASSYYLCVGVMEPNLIRKIPADADVALPPNPLLDEIAVGHVHRGWFINSYEMQSVTNYVSLIEYCSLCGEIKF